ncbi:helix-turn-helix domain-containing protein [Novosphingobium sp. JCM 18896]|uniref:helix-turn-helix domain-containing protein n=1 Tax=Novosphingobium sp. JCM 18896 TaxID=2989731 RepID=UPI0022212D41|nr:helix-turn-helix domain-containing protein [Novosphingobium sp. JCM 18896]
MSVGARLRLAREKQRLSRADIAARTKIAERHLAAIEEERFADLASSTYAVGFSRAYARAVGLDEREIAQAVRVELDMVDEVEVAPKPTFEPGDPARVPSVRLAWVAGAAALAVVAAVVVFWGSYIFPAVSLPDLLKETPPPAAKKAVAAAPAAPAGPTAQSPVTITAKEAGVWVKITDASGKKLFEKQMAQGESFTIPTDAAEPKLRTGWPDALAVTIGGQPVAPLADKRVVTTVPVSAAALLARGLPAPAPVAPPAAAPAAPAQAVTAPAQTTPVQAAPARAAPAPATTQRNVPTAPAARPSTAPAARATPAPQPSPRATRPPLTLPPVAPEPAPAAPAAEASPVSQ